MSPLGAASGLPAAAPAGETGTALRNTAKLGASMMATWGVAVGVRILLPRHLGPESFGALNFADAFTALVFLVVGLGVDTYVRKEVSVRPEHVNDFFGGVLLIRLALVGLAFGAVAAVLHATGRPPEVRAVVYLFGAYQFLFTHNATLAAVLQAKGRVGGLSVANVGTKLLWAGGVVAALLFGARLDAIAVAFVAAEAAKTWALTALARRHVGLRHGWSVGASLPVIVSSLPFFATTLTVTAGSRLGVNVLGFAVGSDREIGWYGASLNLSGAAIMLAPIISSVLTPLLARAAARSERELDLSLRRSLEVILTIAVPTSLAGALGADLWTRLLLGEAFAPATTSLRILLAILPLTYIGIVSASALVLLDRGWTLTLISVASVAADLVACLLLVHPLSAALGPGGAGTACAAAVLVHELVSTALMFSALGRRCVDPRLLAVVPRLVAAAAAAVAVDRALAGIPAPARLAAALGAYAAASLLLDGARLRELAAQARATFFHPAGVAREA